MVAILVPSSFLPAYRTLTNLVMNVLNSLHFESVVIVL